eukprot:TRINITY_DN11736_c0_g2_i1.p1 TRINITY_DN11736_c0_g2~~TRINITY_DN11736_c0_g2_i1.p1  ORF type:complete len:357 (+),score=52.64 TRINITY_DN11736_c0_g2_i1:35-1105(+)
MGELRMLDFYSGIGGLHHALERAWPSQAKLCAAFDVNCNANVVYERCWKCQVKTRSIEHLTVRELEKHDANMWLLSPPCQPYTKIGNQRDSDDPRAKSFLHLCDMIATMTKLPTYLFVENVAEFHGSNSHHRFLEALYKRGYGTREVIISPEAVGVPNTRTRYYCLARLHESLPAPWSYASETAIVESANTLQLTACPRRSIGTYLERDLPEDVVRQLIIPAATLAKAGDFKFDVVAADSLISTTFTKGYGDKGHLRGSGPVLLLNADTLQPCTSLPNADDSGSATTESSAAKRTFRKVELGEVVRLFAPVEMLRIHGFPDNMDMAMLTLKQQRKLIGNSVNVDVIAKLMRLFEFT